MHHLFATVQNGVPPECLVGHDRDINGASVRVLGSLAGYDIILVVSGCGSFVLGISRDALNEALQKIRYAGIVKKRFM